MLGALGARVRKNVCKPGLSNVYIVNNWSPNLPAGIILCFKDHISQRPGPCPRNNANKFFGVESDAHLYVDVAPGVGPCEDLAMDAL